MLNRICNFISKYMAGIVIVVAAMALLVPASFNWISTSWITPLLGLVMFGMGLTLDPHDFKVVFTRPKDIIIGSLAQFIIMPLTAFLLSRVFGLSDELAIGVILVGCCPGGTASNVMTYLAKGDLALSVGMTTVKKCSAISIEVGMQNSGLASSLATVHFAMYPMATVPGAIFSVWHNVSGAVVAKIYAKQQEKEERKK